MFESILEKILKKQLGKFIEGIDAENLNLGVWSGKVKIENVTLKPEILSLLEIPLRITFSSIGCLLLNVPWSKLSSSPVEVILEDIYVIFAPVAQQNWQFVDYSSINKKIELIESFISNYAQKILDKDKQTQKKQEDQSYLEKLTWRILDNLQITVRNIHVRFENDLTKNYAFGLTLDQIDIMTTDQQWKKNFFDRTDKKNKSNPMFKIFQQRNFGFYWNPQDQLVSQLPYDQIKTIMKETIERGNAKAKNSDYLIKISSIIKLIQSQESGKTKFEEPEFQVLIDLEKIDVQIGRIQVQQMISLGEFFGVYFQKMNAQKKLNKEITEEENNTFESQFKEIYAQVIQQEKIKSIEDLDKDSQLNLQKILQSIELDQIFLWLKPLIKDFYKKQKLSELYKTKKNQQKSYWFMGKRQEIKELVSEEEKKQFDQFFEENFSDENLNLKHFVKPSDYIWFTLQFNLQKGSFFAFYLNSKLQKEGVSISYQNFEAFFKLREKNSHFLANLKTFSVDLITEEQDKKVIKTNFLKPNDLIHQKINKFLILEFEKNPIEQDSIDSQIFLQMQSTKILFNPILLDRINKIIDIQSEEQLRLGAWDQVDRALEQTQKKLNKAIEKKPVIRLKIEVQSPVLILPVFANNDPNNACWVLNLGQLNIDSENEGTNNETIYDCFIISLQQIQMQYFTSILFYEHFQMKSQNLQTMILDVGGKHRNQEQFTLIQQFSIKINVKIQKTDNQVSKEEPQIMVEAILPNLNLQINPQTYQQLLKFSAILAPGDKSLQLEMIQTEKAQLVQNAKKMKEIWKRQPGLHSWKKYYCVLSGGYLYFFSDVKDLQPEFYLYVRNAKVNSIEENVNNIFPFSVSNRIKEFFLGSIKENDRIEWINAINSIRTNIQQEKKKKISENVSLKQMKQDVNQVKYKASFQIESIDLCFQNSSKKTWLNFKSKSLQFDFIQRPYDVNMNLKLNSIMMEDFVQEHPDKNLNYFLSSIADQKKENIDKLVIINLRQMDKQHPQYENVELEIEIWFGSLLINFKPDIVLKLLAFVVPKSLQEPKEISPLHPIKSSKEVKDLSFNLSQDLPAEQIIRDNTSSQAQYVNNQELTILRAKFHLQQISMNLIHRKTNSSIAQIKLKNCELILQQKLDELVFQGQLGNLQIYDMTNYPETIFDANEHHLIIPKQILGVSSNQNSLLEIDFTMYEKNSMKIKDNVDLKMKMNISEIEVDFIMQPFMRIIDYALVQILGVLTQPEKFETVVRGNETKDELGSVFQSNLAYSQQNQQRKRSNKDEAQIIQMIKNPSKMQINIEIKNPRILLKSNPQDSSFLIIDLGFIQVENSIAKRNDRIISQPGDFDSVFCDVYIILMNDLSVQIKRNEKQYEITQKFQFHIQVEMLKFQDEIKQQFPQVQINNCFLIKSQINPVVFSISKSDYLLMMKTLFGNIIYDDLLDKKFIHDQYELPLEYKPNIVPIDFCLDIENISLFAFFSYGKYLANKIPFAGINMEKLRIKFDRDSQKQMHLNLFGFTLKGSCYEILDENQIKEDSLLGEIKTSKYHNISQFQYIDQIQKLSLDRNQIGFQNFSNSNSQFQLFLQMMPESGELNIQIKMGDIIVRLEPFILLNLAKFGQLSKEVEPNTPKIIRENKLSLIQVPQAIKKDKAKQTNNLKFNCSIKNIIICIPSSQKGSDILVGRGAIMIMVTLSKPLTLDQILKEMKDNNLKYEDTSQLNETMKVNFSLNELEVFVCESMETVQSSFSNVSKRHFIMPFSMFLNLKNLLPLAPKDFFYNKTQIDINLEKTSLRFSFKDITLIQKTVEYQLEGLTKQEGQYDSGEENKSYQSQLTSKDQLQSKIIEEQENRLKLMSQELKPGETSALNDIKISIFSYGIQTIIINDIQDSLVPLLTFNIYDFNCIINQNIVLMSSTCLVSLSASFFNPQNGRWEPFIEKVGLDLDFVQRYENNNIACNLELHQEYQCLNITISNQMIIGLMNAFTFINQDWQQKQRMLKKSKSNSDTKIQYMSPYTIENNTGYRIQIDRDLSELQEKVSQLKNISGIDSQSKISRNYQLENGEKMNFQLEQSLDKMFEESEEEDLIHKSLVKIKILSDRNTFQEAKGINLDRIRVRRYQLEGSKTSLKMFSMVCNVEFKDNRKILVVSSPLVFRNLTSKIIQLKINDDENSSKNLILDCNFQDPDEKFPIPVDLINKGFQVKFSESQEYSVQQNFESYLAQKHHDFFEICIESNYLILFVEKEMRGIGRTIVSFEPPFMLKNCLPIQISLQVFYKKKTEVCEDYKLKPQEQLFLYHISLGNKVFVRVNIQGFFWSEKINLFKNEDKEIILKDIKGLQGKINIYSKSEQCAAREFYFYTKGFIINHTDLNMIFYSKPDKKGQFPLELAGQFPVSSEENLKNHITLFSDQSSLFVAPKDYKTEISKEFSVSQGIFHNIDYHLTTQEIFELTSISDLIQVDHKNKLFTMIVNTNPRIIIENQMKKKIGFIQKNCEGIQEFAPEMRKPFIWKKKNKERNVYLSVWEEKFSCWSSLSGHFSPVDVGLISLLIRSSKNVNVKYFIWVDIRLDENNILYVILKSSDEGNQAYLVRNEVKNMNLLFYQEGLDRYEQSEVCEPLKQQEFAWEYPSQRRVLSVEIIPFDSDNYETAIANINIDKINQIQEIRVDIKKKKSTQSPIILESIVTVEGYTKILTIRTSEKNKRNVDTSDKNKQLLVSSIMDSNQSFQQKAISFKLCQLGISLVQNFKEETCELLYLVMKNFELAFITQQSQRFLQMRIQFLNIDNNTNYNVEFPVIFTPNNRKELLDEKSSRYFLNFLIGVDTKTTKMNFFNTISLEIEPFTLKIEEEYIYFLLDFIQILTDSQSRIFSQYSLQKQSKKLDYQQYPQNHFWQMKQLPEFQTSTYIDKLILSPIKMTLTFKKGVSNIDDSSFKFLKFFSNSLGLVLANIDEAPLKLNGIQIDNCFDNQTQISDNLLKHYKANFLREILKILGSIDILGNPVGLFNNIGTGVVDLFEKPYEGFVKGPLEGGKGIFIGAGSLIQHTVAGTFNSINKFTGSIGSGISQLSLDKDYLEQRSKLKSQKPKHIGEGMKQAGVSLFSGIEKGLTGIFTKPIEGIQRDGAKGFLKGTFQGITGIFVKPVTGLLDATSKTAEGFKNTALHFENKPNEQRQRLVRVFYGPEKFIKSYQQLDAEIVNLLQNFQKGKFKKNHFLDAIRIMNQNQLCTLVLMVEDIIFLNASEKIWRVKTQFINKIEERADGILIILNYKHKKYGKQVEIPCNQKSELDITYKKLVEVKEIYHDIKGEIA